MVTLHSISSKAIHSLYKINVKMKILLGFVIQINSAMWILKYKSYLFVGVVDWFDLKTKYLWCLQLLGCQNDIIVKCQFI